MKENNIIEKILGLLVAIGMLAIIIVVTIQVLGRTPILSKAPHWTEEVSRMIFVFIVSIGAIVGTARAEFVSVDLLTNALKGKIKIIFQMVIDLVMAVFFFVLIPAGMKFVKLGARQTSPSLQVNMKYIYACILITIIGMGLANLYKVVKAAISLKNYKEEK